MISLTYPPVINGTCSYCGGVDFWVEDNPDDPLTGTCPNDECPSHDPPYQVIANCADDDNFNVEYDSNGRPQVSRASDEPGARVLGWKWVPYIAIAEYPHGFNPAPPSVLEP
jgi:hypothetical protein